MNTYIKIEQLRPAHSIIYKKEHKLVKSIDYTNNKVGFTDGTFLTYFTGFTFIITNYYQIGDRLELSLSLNEHNNLFAKTKEGVICFLDRNTKFSNLKLQNGDTISCEISYICEKSALLYVTPTTVLSSQNMSELESMRHRCDYLQKRIKDNAKKTLVKKAQSNPLQ